jgi:pimeloyl-ACP methyl ester carboxylesterase
LIKQRHVFSFAEAQVAYTLFRTKAYDTHISGALTNSSSIKKTSPRRIILLHGAGVAGELTWTFIANYLKHWDEVLVPDLLGMGESYFEPSDQLAFTIEDICHSLQGLLRHLKWDAFDLVGYSLGGLVALELNAEASRELNNQSTPDTIINSLCLIEPALFSDHSLESALSFRQLFLPLAASIKLQPHNDEHFLDFLNLVSPNRKCSTHVDKLAIQRLQLRPLGFAHALMAVSNFADCLGEFKLQHLIGSIPKGLGIIGGLSNPGLLLAQQKIQDQLKSQSKLWHIESLANTDHSLVYVRPKTVASLINEYLY